MASVYFNGATEDTLYYVITGLSFPVKDYSHFKVFGSRPEADNVRIYPNSSGVGTISGLNADTSYTLNFVAYLNNTGYSIGRATRRTRPKPVEKPGRPTITLSNETENSIYFSVYASRADKYKVTVYSGSYLVYDLGNRTSGTISGLEPDTYYTVYAEAYNSGGWGPTSGAGTRTKKIELPLFYGIIFPEVSQTSIKFRLNESGGTSYRTKIYKEDTFISELTSREGTFSGLSPETTYTFISNVANKGGYVQKTATQETAKRTVFKWSKAPKAGESFSIQATDWRDLCANINNWQGIKGRTKTTFSYVGPGTLFTSSIFNQVLAPMRNLGASQVPSDVRSGDPCYAKTFLDLEKAFNSIN